MKPRKIIIFVIVGVVILASVFLIRAFTAPPEYAEIKDRVEYLINASHDINDIVWGKGLETYERVFDPQSSLDVYETGRSYTDANGLEKPFNYYYYRTLDTDFVVYAYKPTHEHSAIFTYAYMSAEPLDAQALAAKFPKGEEHPDNENYYTLVASNEGNSKYYYIIPFTETEYVFYYEEWDEEGYDYVVNDSEYNSIEKIKDYIKTVYSEEYAASLDATLFDGVLEGEYVSLPRYKNTSDYRRREYPLMKLSGYEPKFEERRVYLFDTARINRDNSNCWSVQVEIDTYLPSEPEEIVVAKVNFDISDDGQWYLSSPTY